MTAKPLAFFRHGIERPEWMDLWLPLIIRQGRDHRAGSPAGPGTYGISSRLNGGHLKSKRDLVTLELMDVLLVVLAIIISPLLQNSRSPLLGLGTNTF
jgi:hypothetical protein